MARPARFLPLVMGFLLLTGCSSGGDTGGGAESPSGGEAATAVDAGEEFCAEAGAFMNDRSVTDVRNFSAEFFAGVDRRLAVLVDDAPAAVRADFETLRAGFADSDQIFAEFDYDVSDQRLAGALDAVDNSGMLDATDSIRRHLQQECGPGLTAEIDPGQVDDIMSAFGVDRSLAECLNRELGDVANIDSENLTPELLTRPVCGTTLIAILSGAPPPG